MNGLCRRYVHFRAAEQATPQVAPQVAPQVTHQVTGEAWRLLPMMIGEMKHAEIQQALGLKHEDDFRNAYLLPVLAGQMIEMTQTDKPRSSKQHYCLTPHGAALKAEQNNKDSQA